MAIKQKTLWTFISEGLVSIQLYLYVLAKPSLGRLPISYPNDVRAIAQSHFCDKLCIDTDMFLNFIIEGLFPKIDYWSSVFLNNPTFSRVIIYLDKILLEKWIFVKLFYKVAPPIGRLHAVFSPVCNASSTRSVS